MLTMPILYEDEDLLVLNKPAGRVVNQAKTNSELSIQEEVWLQVSELPIARGEWLVQIPDGFDDSFGDADTIWEQRQGMVHRLDKDTSGVLIWAKHPGALISLLAQFRQRTTAKEYLCLTHGRFTIDSDTINLPMKRAKFDRQRFAVDPEGRPAVTEYQVEASFSGLNEVALASHPEIKQIRKNLRLYQAGFSLVRCWPKTGRTHQIRVHLHALQHPIVGDTKYVGKKRAVVDQLWCARQFLHAAKLTINHPRTNQPVTFTAELPSDLEQALSLLEPE